MSMDNMEAVIDLKLKALHSDVSEIKSSLSMLADAITKLALVEERQAASNAALDRAFSALTDLAARLNTVELALPAINLSTGRASVWIDRALWALVSGGLVYVVKGIQVI